MTDMQGRVADLLATFGGPRACAADLLCDRHPASAIAFTVVEPDLTHRSWTFLELAHRSACLATALSDLGVRPGDRVATLMGKSADLVVTVLALWRLGAVHVPLFTAFAPPAIAARIARSGAHVVVTEPAQRVKLGPNEDIPAQWGLRVICTGESGDFDAMLGAPPQEAPVALGGDGLLIELFTSGTTGAPKAVPVPLKAVASMAVYQEFGLDHQPYDLYWNAADPGWAYGLYHAIVGPLALGRRSLLLHSGFSPALTWSVLAGLGVTNFAAGPTVYRALRADGGPPPRGLALRHCSSAGEPLPRDVSEWAQRMLGVPIYDHYGQTELGMVIANPWHPALHGEPRPGAMGRPLPGWRLEALRPESPEPAGIGERGRLAVDLVRSPLMWFAGYREPLDPKADPFTPDGRWYLTGDTAAKDADGQFHFTARDDDVILMAGYRIGPSEVEDVLLAHDAVAEAAVTGEPDGLRGEVLVAHVVLRPGFPESIQLAGELQRLVKTRFAAHAYPRVVHFVPALPRTPSGKIRRAALKQSR